MDIYPLSYVYKIVDKSTGEFYIGSRSGHIKFNRTPEEDFMKHYFSSGKLKDLVMKNPSNFECSIVFKSGEPKVAYWYEQLLIRESISNPLCANKHFIDPDTGKDTFSMSGKLHSEATRIRQSLAQKGKVAHTAGKSWKWSSDEARKRHSALKLGKPQRKELNERRSKTLKDIPKPILTCPHCGQSGGKPAMTRWHFDNCKLAAC